MSNATEIVFLPLKEGLFPVNFADEKFKGIFSTILKQDGVQRLFSGQQVEHPAINTSFIDWDSIGHHETFAKWEGYGSFMESIGSTLNGNPPNMYHVHFDPHPPSVAFSGVTEFLTAYFPTTYSAEDQKTFHENVKKFGSIVTDAWKDCKGTTGGWVVEEQDLPGSSEKAKAYVTLIGWTSVEAHLQYRETQSFKDNIYLLRGAKDLKNVVMFHVAASEFKP